MASQTMWILVVAIITMLLLGFFLWVYLTGVVSPSQNVVNTTQTSSGLIKNITQNITNI